ncbi:MULTISPECIES: MlaD family protein [Sphingopyxis]|jgi:phospholipid/cholesterol/gamma-HCH transport system substrate-binding protein|uniref:MlaD family protein n=1 Tax=Sphingopyxis TaxID=165697 RepID=UPI00082C1507|nr:MULTISPECIES: MlaD family protein [Sphingopyxis]APW72159.1 mammalian cell entry protein [Sphingopyxis granuli]AVA12912.1 MCE family protein [Sphingopyxis sp. MG]ODU30396.1 MAG: mammalian cell entry protein [Sphingopyxis sp. SCN 67-31]UNK80724.1 MlaD family protein [Sphingopyxis granuli]
METRSNNVLVGAFVLFFTVALAFFVVWLANDSGGAKREYDIFFKQSVDGLNKGAQVQFSGVPVGQVRQIALWPDDPQFVRVRIEVEESVPILQGTTAALEGVGFTGVSQIALDGAVKGAPPISDKGPAGKPVIPTRVGGLGELLNTAPQLLQRLSTLSERLAELVDDENQASIKGILNNVEQSTAILARNGPALEKALADTRIAIQQTGNAAEQIGNLAAATQGTIDRNVDPAMRNLRDTLASANQSMQTLEQAISDARPGLRTFSETTVPEANALIRDLRRTSSSLSSLTDKLDQQGAGAVIGGSKLPDYKK